MKNDNYYIYIQKILTDLRFIVNLTNDIPWLIEQFETE